MPRYKLTIAYDGTDFCGWQRQLPPAGTTVEASKVMAPEKAPEALDQTPAAIGEPEPDPRRRLVLRTVQEVVQRAVQSIVREPVEVLGASRTDSGVHARAQVAAFTCSGDEPVAASPPHLAESPWRPFTASPPHSPNSENPTSSGWPLSRGTDRLRQALNARLPEDVAVVGVEAVHGTFDPISDCVAKGYSYTLHVAPDRPVFDRRFVHHLWTPLDVNAMRAAAERIVGEHDFAAFAKAGHGRESTVRTVFECRVVEETPRIRIEVSGNGFLYNMVRIIVGTLVEVGRARLTPDDVAAAIESQDRRRAGPTLPPHGLCLEWVRYAAPADSAKPQVGAPMSS